MDAYIEILKFAIPLLAVGGAWGGAKYAIKANDAKIEALEGNLKEHLHEDEATQRVIIDRMARMETKIDMILEKNNG
jgi:hypothetical protein